MEDYRITPEQISASSEWNVYYAAKQGRLHLKTISGGYCGGWVAAVKNLDQWFQIDLRSETSVTAVATQGRNAYSQWVTKYKLQYSNDGNSFQGYKQQEENSDKVRNAYTYTLRKTNQIPSASIQFQLRLPRSIGP